MPSSMSTYSKPSAALVRRLLSEDYANKVIATTIQKFGLAINDLSE